MSDGININKLTDSVKAFAQAADQNNDGVIDKKEVKLFNQFINATNQTQDEGLALERQAVAAADESTPKEKAKEARQIENEVEKSYKNYFGKDNIEAVKAMEGECNRRVISAFNNLKGAKSPDALNRAIAGRPDMADYAGDPEGYKQALDTWADGVETALNQSVVEQTVQQVNAHTDNAAMDIMIHNEFTAEQVAEYLAELITSGDAQIIEEIKNAEGNIEKTIKTSQGQLTKVIYNAAGNIIDVVKQEGDATRNTVRSQGETTRNTVRSQGAKTRHTVRRQGENTRDVVRDEGAWTRNTVRSQGEWTRETVNEKGDEIIDIMDPLHINRDVHKFKQGLRNLFF